jgi:hypothetical protein
MPYVPRVTKAPTDAFALTFEFDDWPVLTASNTLASAVVTAGPAGLTVSAASVDADAKEAQADVAGGTDGTRYRLTCVATTTDGDTLTGYLDLLVSTAADGAALYPSQLLPYMDGRRTMELLYDDGDLAEGVAVPGPDTIDSNDRAFFLVQAAWQDVLTACRRGQIYGSRELTDLASDPVRGQGLIELVADLFWHKAVKRRRYPVNDPQSEDPGQKEAQDMLELLRTGVRIWDLTGVTRTDSTGAAVGTYANPLGDTTALQAGRLGSTDRDFADRRFWGTTDDDRKSPTYRGFWGRGRGC